MDNHGDLSQFLISRRAKLTLKQVGLPDFGGPRRVPGLRREEVALLAGMSSEYYKRLVRGNAKGASEVVIDGVSRALFSEMFEDSRQPVNAARFAFLDARAQTFYRDWEANTRQIVALLRVEAGRSPYDRQLSDLVGELSTRSDLFRKLWGAHDVREHRSGTKSVHHPIVGDLDLNYLGLDLASDRSLQMLVFSAEPGSASHDGLQLLANWAATNSVELKANDESATNHTLGN
ncbi:transcriptional regulator [uncultured Arthrobacter sp.]|uniref:MmyB family transcriptional regulator n=1 Tax=uncultured Arthrobacter sp. TaxID=114050 RepID=UPI0028D1808A|nr:transcriptional regulator [uncultured Arthrobacter sp.]